MKRNNLPLMLVLMISAEMIIAPVASAQQATGFLGVVQAITPVVQQMIGRQNQQAAMAMTSQKIALINQQMAPLPDRYFNAGFMSQLPGLYGPSGYLRKNGIDPSLLECKTLSSKPEKIIPQVCSATSAIQAGPSMQMQVWEAEAYKEAYSKVSEEYKNYSVESTSALRQDQGVGCVKKASEILNAYFLNRFNELNALTGKIEALNNKFREESKGDLASIEDLTALLDGGSNEIVDNARLRDSKLFEYGNRQDPACAAMFTGDRFNSEGEESGLNGINKLLKRTYEQPSGGAKYSAQSYAQAAGAVESDIKNIAIKVAAQAKLNFSSMTERGLSGFISGLKNNISSATGVNSALTADLFSDFQSKFNGKNEDLVKTSVDLNKRLKDAGIDSSEAFSQLRSKNDTLFKSEVASIKNQVKNNCLKKTLGDVKNITDRIEQRGASDNANSVKSVFELAIERILGDDKLTIEQKLEQVKAAESQSNNRYKLKNLRAMDALRDVNGTLVPTQIKQKDIDTPSKYLEQVAKTCDLQYSRSTTNGAPSIKQTVESLRDLRKEYEEFAKDSANEMQAAVTNKLLNCPGDTAGQTVGSCDGAKFNNTSGAFCARTANICSNKMRTCAEKTQEAVSKKKQDRSKVVSKYKDKLRTNKEQLRSLFDGALNQYKAEGDFLAGHFKGEAGFSTPVGISREVPEAQRYLSSFSQATSGSPDGKLLLEDPEKLVELFKSNIEKLKASVKDQQDKIMGGGKGGMIGSHIALIKTNYSSAQRDMESIGQQCGEKAAEIIRAETERANKLAEEMDKKSKEQQKAANNFCRKYRVAQRNPAAGCSGIEGDLFEDLGNLSGAREAAEELEVVCSGYNNESSNEGYSKNDLIIQQAIGKCSQSRDAAGCKDLLNCGRNVGTTTAPKTKPDDDESMPTAMPACPENYQIGFARAVLGLGLEVSGNANGSNNENGQSPREDSSQLGEAPAFCDSGNSSGREVIEGISNVGQAIAGPASTRGL